MNIKEKNEIIKNYIMNLSKQINSQYNGLIDDDKVSRVIQMFSNSLDDLELVIIPKINALAQEVIDNYLKLKEERKKMMLKNIEKNINSPFFMELLKKTWDKTHSIDSVSNLIGELYIHHIINKDGYGFEYYMVQIEQLYLRYRERKISPEKFQLQKAKLISLLIASKLNIDIKNISQEDMEKVKDYFLQEYVTNGYVSHSFPDAYYESIMEHGLVSLAELRKDKLSEIQEIQNIFMNKGVASPMGGYPYYGGSGIYYEHDFTQVFKHAVAAPEWFNWFTSSDHITTSHSDIKKSPYILRSEVDCRRNVDDLCFNAGLNEIETKKVIDFYQVQYNKFNSPKLNVALIPKEIIGKNIISNVVPQDMDLFNTISYVLSDGASQYTEHNGNVYNGTIPSRNFDVSVIPSASNYIKAMQYYRETKEHLTSPKNNLAVLEITEKNINRIVPSMISGVERVKQLNLDKMNSLNNQSSRLNYSMATLAYDKNSLEVVPKKSFDKRTKNELGIYQQIKRKNQIIKQQKVQKLSTDKHMVKSLTNSTKQRSGMNSSKGFINIMVLSLIVSSVVGILFMIGYLLICR